MAERRGGPAAENGGNEGAVPSELRSSNCIDPTLDRIQAPSPQPVLDRLTTQPHRQQLRARDDPMLPAGQREHAAKRLA